LPVSATSISTLAVMSAGTDFQDSSGGHGIARVQEKIQENLLQLVGGAAHRGQAAGEMLHDLDCEAFSGWATSESCSSSTTRFTSTSASALGPVRENSEGC